MPKVVDHDERRLEISRVVARIAAAEGLEAVSMRRVASDAGISAPLVQHYFPSKNAMLRHAVTELSRTAEQAAEKRVRAVVDPEDPAHPVPLFRGLLDEFLPLDDDRRVLLLLHIAFFARALSDPDLASYYRDTFPRLTGDLTELVRAQQATGRVPSGSDPAHEVDTLLTLGIGLGTDMLLGTRTAEESTALIDYHLARLFPDVAPRRPDTGGRNGGDPDDRPGHTGTR